MLPRLLRSTLLPALLSCGFLLTSSGCRSASEAPPREVVDAEPDDARRSPGTSQADAPASDTSASDASTDVVSGVGTIRYVDLEGGFYGIVSAEGERYNPSDLPERFREDGLEVRFRLRLVRDRVTLQMWGQPVDVLDVRPADAPRE